MLPRASEPQKPLRNPQVNTLLSTELLCQRSEVAPVSQKAFASDECLGSSCWLMEKAARHVITCAARQESGRHRQQIQLTMRTIAVGVFGSYLFEFNGLPILYNGAPTAFTAWENNGVRGGQRRFCGPIAVPLIDVAVEDCKHGDTCCIGPGATACALR